MPVFHTEQIKDSVRKVFDLMHSVLITETDGKEETARYLMMSLIAMILPLTEISGRTIESDEDYIQELCRNAKAYINENYMEDLTVQIIAKAMSISPSYLSHIFKDVIGYPVKNYLQRRRIGEAQTLLINTKDSITSIASKVGYGNPNYFNAAFSKNVGMSPSQYRKSYTNKS